MKLANKLPLSFMMSLGIHAAVVGGGGLLFVKPPQFGVDQGLASVEVLLVQTPPEIVVQEPEHVEDPFPVPQPISEPKPKPQVKPVTVQGATTKAAPGYLSNPSPIYPAESRRLKEQGVVLLAVRVDRRGNAIEVSIKKSSGFLRLDQAALKAVKQWKFSAAKLGELAIESDVQVPVRFRLDKQ